MISINCLFKSGTLLVVSLLFFANMLFAQNSNTIRTGIWRGVLTLHEKQSEFGLIELPFNFEVQNELDIYSVVFLNAEERIVANEIAISGDSVFIRMPLYDSEFRCKILGDSLKGVWINHARKDKNTIPFRAFQGSYHLFYKSSDYLKGINISGNWQTIFNPFNAENKYEAVGKFTQNNIHLTGTFLTETGDFRFLEGEQCGLYTIKFSCFDGAHACLITGKVKGDSIVNGHIYSGSMGHETWLARRNDKFQLRNPDSLTFLKPGFSKVDFSFKNLEGKTVSSNDEKFKNKVLIIQILGSWCPNCMDETKFLASFYNSYKSKGLEIIGLAFEKKDDFKKSVSNILRVKNRFDVKYEFLITEKGAGQASEALPMLNKVMAFPTTIYIDKKGNVRKIYTGFYGPATGDNYKKYVEETTGFVEKLLAE